MQKKSRLFLLCILITAFLALSAFGWEQLVICKVLIRSHEVLAPVEVPQEDITPEWMLILVNSEHPLTAEYEFPQEKVNGYVFDARAAADLRAMLQAAREDGINLIICSAYRSIDKQTALFERKINQYQKAGYSYEKAYDIAKTIVAIPGTSEHHTGLAVDVVTPEYQQLNEGFENTEAFRWLEENCSKYGFIMRYPAEKKEITGIIYEPWHYRYVGVNVAEKITDNGWCLEEYIDYLAAEQEQKKQDLSLLDKALPAIEEKLP